MAPVEDTTKPNVVVQISRMGNQLPLLVWHPTIRYYCLVSKKYPFVTHFLNPQQVINFTKGKGQLTSIHNQQNLCKSSIYYESVFATKGVGHYLAYLRYVSIFDNFCMRVLMIFSKLYHQIIFNIREIKVSYRCHHGK